MKFLDDLSNLKHIVMAEGDDISLGEIGRGGYGYTENGEEKRVPFPDSILITLDDASYRNKGMSRLGEDPQTFEIIIPEVKRAELLALLTAGSGRITV